YQGDQIISMLQEAELQHLSIRFVHNNDWEKSNGLSLLAARQWVTGPFILMMGDHLLTPDAIRKICRRSIEAGEIRLGIDRNPSGVFDLEDATKVLEGGRKIQFIGKRLDKYSAIDTGLFLCGAEVFSTFAEIFQVNGDVSLSEGVALLAKRGQAQTEDLTGFFWLDVDTPEAMEYGEQCLLKRLAKKSDGFISRHLNRKISIQLTKVFLKYNWPVKGVWALGTFIGILSGLLISFGEYPYLILGGLLFQFSAILDGCDGEMARLTMTESKGGEWLDTIGDNIVYLAFMIGVVLGTHHQQPGPHVYYEGIMLFSGLILTWVMMFYYLNKYSDSGSLISVQWVEPDKNSPWTAKLALLMRSDFFAMLFMVLAFFGKLHWILWLGILGANGTWMVVLANKREVFLGSLSKDEKVLASGSQ
ncbi:MAG: CDP-alcohol phosphatidyltransferase family protein, partial [Nitrospirales bacterium]|nr:CDP-alcohol phosphatidyltransferase family protein [Nitrospirales bacterium]